MLLSLFNGKSNHFFLNLPLWRNLFYIVMDNVTKKPAKDGFGGPYGGRVD